MRRRIAILAVIPLMALAATSSACGSSAVEYAKGSSDHDTASLERLLGDTRSTTLEQQPSSEAVELRREALIELRGAGEDERRAADLITSTFPGVTRAVPYYVETATFRGQPALIFIEATGREGANMNERRLWVLDDSGGVLLTLMR